jgi:hypothetical protein
VSRWWEEYKCGCVSDPTSRKRDLPGYCPKHGDDSRGAQREIPKKLTAQKRTAEQQEGA